MTTTLIFDTECTSRNDDREVIEAAWIQVDAVEDLAGPSDRIPEVINGVERCERFKPARPIENGAAAVHHILPEDLQDCPLSLTFALPPADYIVGHNIDFDWEAAGKPDVKRICTDAMSRWVWPDMDAYSQSALLYGLLGQTAETRILLRGAHSALTDVQNNVLLLQLILRENPEIETWGALHEFSERCRIPRVIPFGKYKGETPAFVADMDPGYVDWVRRQDWVDPYLLRAFDLAEQEEPPLF